MSAASLMSFTVEGRTRTRGVSNQKVKLVIPSPKYALSGRPLAALPS